MPTKPKKKKIRLVFSIETIGDNNETTIQSNLETLSDLNHAFEVISDYHFKLMQAISNGRYTHAEEQDAQNTPLRIQPVQNLKGQL